MQANKLHSQQSNQNHSEEVCLETENETVFRVCLVGVKIIFMENNFLILRCLAKKKRKIIFRGK